MTSETKLYDPFTYIPPPPRIGIKFHEEEKVYNIPVSSYRSIGEPSRALMCPYCGDVWDKFIMYKDDIPQHFLPLSSPCKRCKPLEGGRKFGWMSDELLSLCPQGVQQEEFHWLDKFWKKYIHSPDWYFSPSPRSLT